MENDYNNLKKEYSKLKIDLKNKIVEKESLLLIYSIITIPLVFGFASYLLENSNEVSDDKFGILLTIVIIIIAFT